MRGGNITLFPWRLQSPSTSSFSQKCIALPFFNPCTRASAHVQVDLKGVLFGDRLAPGGAVVATITYSSPTNMWAKTDCANLLLRTSNSTLLTSSCPRNRPLIKLARAAFRRFISPPLGLISNKRRERSIVFLKKVHLFFQLT